MVIIRPGISEKIRKFDYGILVQYRRPFIYIGQYFTLYWISSLGILFSLSVCLGNGDVGNNDRTVTCLCAWKQLYIVR